jgi:hypothetical protein
MRIGGISFASSSWAAGASLADQDACFRGGACECLPSGCGKATSLEIVWDQAPPRRPRKSMDAIKPRTAAWNG